MPDDHSVYAGTRRTILRVIVFSFIVFIIAAIAFISAISLFYLHPNLKSMKSIDLQDLNLFSHPALFPLSAVVMFHGFFVWNVVLTLYVIISIVAYAELKKYNEELQLLGQGSENPDEICDELLKKFLKCVEYGKMVRNIDNVFEVYTFIMVSPGGLEEKIINMFNIDWNKHSNNHLFAAIIPQSPLKGMVRAPSDCARNLL